MKNLASAVALAAAFGGLGGYSSAGSTKSQRSPEDAAERIERAAFKRRRKNAWRLVLVSRGGFA